MLALLLAAVLALPAGAASARQHDAEKLPITHIRDLHYGDALFYFYQDDDFAALTRLLAYEHWGRVPHHAEEAQLLEGGLYLTLGMHNEAGERFERLLTNDVPTGVRNRAWFYVAQVWYARGYLERADAALRKVNGRMSPELESQKELLFGNVLMHEGRYDEAIRLLSSWRGAQIWSAYARFNLGVALVRNGRLDDADPFLSAVGTMLAATAELAALRDRANLALGFAYLQANQPARARAPLARVRLNGPYSNKALLGIGWADAGLGDYQAALTPWMELRSRDVLDAAVQDCQEGLKNYRDLVYLNGTLERWGDSMGAFQDMIETRERAYAERLPRADALLASGAVGKLQQRNVTLASELRTIETQRDMAALGTTVEREQWARVQRVEAALAAAPDTPENANLRVRLALVKGVLQFRVNDAFNARLWQEHRALKDLSLALHEAPSRWIPVGRDRKNVPTNNGEVAARVTALQQRIDTLQARLGATEQKQSVFLARLAAHQLEEQKDRLAAYQVQARFALASMYDRAANAGTQKESGGNQAAPAEETPAPPEQAPAPPEQTPAPPEQTPAPPEQAPAPKAAEPPR